MHHDGQLLTSELLRIRLVVETEPNWALDSCPAKSSCARQHRFAFLRKPCGITQSLKNILTLYVRIIGKKFVDGATRTDLSYYIADRHPHATNASLAAHHVWLLGDVVKLFHCLRSH